MSKDKKETVLRTWTGRRVNPLEMTAADVCIDDIAQALGNQCRYNGHCAWHYSIAQHSIYLSYIVPGELQKRGLFNGMPKSTAAAEANELARVALLHDGAEAYFQDVITPLKPHFRYKSVPLKTIEARIEAAVFEAFGLNHDYMALVYEFDKRICMNEKRALRPYHEVREETHDPIPDLIIERLLPEQAVQRFLTRAKELGIPHESTN